MPQRPGSGWIQSSPPSLTRRWKASSSDSASPVAIGIGLSAVKLAIAVDILRLQRLFEKEGPELLELAGARERRLPVPHLARVDQDVDVAAGPAPGLAHERDIGRLVLTHRAPAELDRGEAHVGMATGEVAGLGRRVAEEDRAIGPEACRAGGAEERMDRLARGLAGDVPERDVDPSHGVGTDPDAPVIVGAVVHRAHAPLYIACVAALQDVAEPVANLVRERRIDHRLHDGRAGIDLAPADQARFRGDANETGVLTAVAGIGDKRQPEHEGGNVGDLHHWSRSNMARPPASTLRTGPCG